MWRPRSSFPPSLRLECVRQFLTRSLEGSKRPPLDQTARLKNEPGALARLTGRLGEHGIDIRDISAGAVGSYGCVVLSTNNAHDVRIVDLPVRYRSRTYGDTNIQRWSHGWLLLRMVIFAARRLKFR